MKPWSSFGALLFLMAFSLSTLAADISGSWSASFDTQIGKQNYTYEFQVKGTALTGKIKSANGESAVEDGTVEGDTVSFVEHMNYQGNTLKINYAGKIVSADEIDFTRSVGEFATEQLVARRLK